MVSIKITPGNCPNNVTPLLRASFTPLSGRVSAEPLLGASKRMFAKSHTVNLPLVATAEIMENCQERRPYLGFYTAHQISPVTQDISALQTHFERRGSLYKQLGIPPSLFRNRTLLELGPGSGYNAIYTTTLGLSRYVLVDGNPTALDELRRNFAKFQVRHEHIAIVESLIESFATPERFDIVLCEGVIPWQLDSKAFAQHIAKYAATGGLIVVTCIDAASFLGESLRRIIAAKFSPFADPMESRLAVLENFFAPHLRTLRSMNRPIRDWIQDNILIKYYAGFFSITDAIEALEHSCSFYSSSPKFVQDWRWYKDQYGVARRQDSAIRLQYLANVANLVDYRFEVPPHSVAIGEQILRLGNDIFQLMLDIEESYMTQAHISDLSRCLQALANEISVLRPETRAAFLEVVDYFNSNQDPLMYRFSHFLPFFGRGQQYVSFAREE